MLSFWLCARAVAQPAAPPAKPSFAELQDIEDTVAALVESTQNDEGYAAAQKVVVGASPAPSLPRAWHEWRVASLTGEDPTAPLDPAVKAPAVLTTRLLVQDVEVEEFNPGRGPGGALTGAATAKVRVRLNLATETPDRPIEDWPADPWQGEFALQKAAGQDANGEAAPWQFTLPIPDALLGEAPQAADKGRNALIALPERGGNRLEQAIQVVRDPEAMLRTARLLRDTRSLTLLVDAVQRYVALNGHYPPADYQTALLDGEPSATQPALRRAFIIEGTARFWLFNPALAGAGVPQAPDPATPPVAVDNAAAADAPPTAVPWFWDSAAKTDPRLVAFGDGRVEFSPVPDLPAAPAPPQ